MILIDPDPDSLASAMAVKRLLRNRIQRATIACIKEIQRLDDLAMVKLLKIPLVKSDDLNPEDFSRKVLLDSQPHHHVSFEPYTYNAIIDHHPRTKVLQTPFVDVRPEYGANSTILIGHLRPDRRFFYAGPRSELEFRLWYLRRPTDRDPA
jgi:nanoRNase/pAp phosphatase (c-di-AMP/oligoRNAs hydrolase)